jgi:phosphoribosylamine--glycine ligase
MKILVIGSGGREHALVWRLLQGGHEVLAAPGNPGIAAIARCLPVEVGDHAGLERLSVEERVGLVVVGPEAPLVAGLADRLRARDLLVFGPGAVGARLEGSKVFSKEFFARHGIRTAGFAACATVAEADAAIDRLGDRVVVKADGLAAGKGVVVCGAAAEARVAAREMLAGRFGDAGSRIIVEQRLTGRELSVMALTDGHRVEVLAQAEDHKTVFDGDRGPNTGGMGTVSPAAWTSAALLERVGREVFAPTLAGLAAEGVDYRGVLYAGLMVGDDGVPWLLEYNCRFGDPETQPVMARLRGDLAVWLAGAAAGAMPAEHLDWDPRTAVCVVVAAEGYPDAPVKGDAITGLEAAAAGGGEVVVFHAATERRASDGALVSAGGRVLGVTALGADVLAARAAAYQAVTRIQLRGMHYRTDIGARGSRSA